MKFLIVKSISIQWHYNVYYAAKRTKNNSQNDINYRIFSKYSIKSTDSPSFGIVYASLYII